MVQRLTCRLHRKDGGEFAFVYPKDFLEGTPSSAKEDGIEFAIVFKEDPETLWNGKDCVAMGYVLWNSRLYQPKLEVVGPLTNSNNY